MKVAVCISGVLRGLAEENIKIMKEIFPYDFFLSTWNTVDKFTPFEDIKTYEEPRTLDLSEVYHPNKNLRIKLTHGQKQIIAHAYMLRDLSLEYDFIIRARFDARINSKIKWSNFVDVAYEKQIPIGIGSQVSIESMDHTKKIIYGQKGERTTTLGGGLNDAIIFHPRKLFSSDRVFELYESKTLKICEFGWWQILVEENFGNVSYEHDPCENYIGGVLLDRYLK